MVNQISSSPTTKPRPQLTAAPHHTAAEDGRCAGHVRGGRVPEFMVVMEWNSTSWGCRHDECNDISSHPQTKWVAIARKRPMCYDLLEVCQEILREESWPLKNRSKWNFTQVNVIQAANSHVEHTRSEFWCTKMQYLCTFLLVRVTSYCSPKKSCLSRLEGIPPVAGQR